MPGMEAPRLKQFVNALDRTERLVLMLFYAERLTPAEISQILDITQEGVANVLANLRTRVGAMLKPAAVA